MSVTYTYSVATNFPSGINISQLSSEIIASAISSATLIGINLNGDVVQIVFSNSLSGGDLIILNALISAFVPIIVLHPGTILAGTSNTNTSFNYIQTANRTITIPDITDTLITRATTDTLTNKTLTSNTDNIIARGLWDTSGAGSVSTYASAAPTTGQVLIATTSSTATWQSISAIVTPQVTFGDSQFAVYNLTDNTKQLLFNNTLATTGTSTSIQTTQTTSETLTLPNVSDTLIGRSTTDTLTNKTLTSNTDNVLARGLWDSSGAGSVSTYASTAPTTGQYLVATTSSTATWQSLPITATQVTFGDAEFSIYGMTDNTKQLVFSNSLATTGTSTTVQITQSANETLTLPNVSDTLIGRNTTDTLINKTLTSNTDNVLARGLWDTSGAGSVSTYASAAPTTGQVLIATNSTTATWQSISAIVTPQVTFGDSQFTVYNLADNTKQLIFNNNLGATGTSTALATTQTASETLTLPNISDTLVGRSTTDTLTNKTLTSNTDNIIARGLWDTSGAGSVSTYASTAPTTGQVLIATTSSTATWQSISAIVTPQVTFGDSQFTVYNVTDNTKQLLFNNVLATTATSTTLATTQTASETLTLPNVSDTLVGRSTTDTLTNKTLTSNTDNVLARGLWDTSGAGSVSTYASAAPTTGQVLIATTASTATWQSISAIVTPQVTFGDSQFAVYNLTDNTKQLLFNNVLATTATSTTLATTQTASETLTLPNVSDTLIGRSTTDTLTNKTLTSNTDNVLARGLWDTSGAGSVSTYASTAPTTGQVLIATTSSTATWQSISAIVTPQVTFGDSQFAVYNVTDNTKQLLFNNVLATTGTATTFATTQTASETLTLPNVSDTLVGRSTTDTLTNKTLTSNTNNVLARGLWDTSGAGSVSTYASAAPTTGQVLIATTSSTATWQSISAIVTPQVTFGDSQFTVYNATDNTKQLLFNNVLATTATSTTLATTQTASETLTLPNVSDTLIGRSTTDTLTNKTLTSNTDNVLARGLWDTSGAGSVSTYASAAPTTGQVLIATTSSTATWQSISAIVTPQVTFGDSQFAVYNLTDNTKQLLFNNTLATTATTTTIATTQPASETLTLPNVSDTIVGRSTTDTLTNKTLTSNTDNVLARGLWDTSGAGSVSTYASAAPTTGQVLIATTASTATWQSISAIVTPQVTFGDSQFTVYNATDNTKQLLFNNVLATTATATTLATTQTASETLTLPNVSDTLVGRSTTDTLTNKTLTSNTDNVLARGLWDTSGSNSVSTYASAAPTTGQVLIATNSTTATWQSISAIVTPQVTFGDSQFTVYNATDNTKQLLFNNVLATTATSTTLATTQTASETLTFPNVSDTLVGRSTTDTLTNKTLTSNTDNVLARGLWDTSGSNSVSTYASAAPTTGQYLVATNSTTATWQSLPITATQVTFGDSEFSIYNLTDNTKQLLFNNVLATTATSTTLATTQTASETVTLPNVSDTLVGRSTTDTLTNKTLTSNTDNVLARGLWDTSGAGSVSTYASAAPTTGQVLIATNATTATWQSISAIVTPQVTFGDSQFTVYNVTDNTKQLLFNNVLATTATATTLATTQTANETLTLPNVSDTLVGRSTTDTLTNKTLTSNTDNVIARGLWDTSGAGSVSTYASAAPTTGQVLIATNATTATWQSISAIVTPQVTFGDSQFTVYNVTDNTKQLIFNNTLATTATSTTLAATQTASETLTLPNVSDTLIGRSTTDTLTNKTLTSNTDNIIARGLWDTSGAGSVSTYASAAPTTGQYLVATNATTATWQSLPITATQVTFGDSEFTIYNLTDNTKQLAFNNVLATTATSTTLATTQTANETLTLPNVSDTLVGRSTTDTLTNKTLTSNTDNVLARGLWDTSGAGSVSTYASAAPTTGQYLVATNATTATWQSLPITATQVTFGDSEFSIYNLTDNTKQLIFNNSLATTATSTTLAITQTASETLTLPNVSDTLVGRSTTDTLINKTLTSNTDNIIARGLWDSSGAGSVSVYASSAPTTGQVLAATSATTATWQSFTAVSQVTFGDAEFSIYNLTDQTKQLLFNNVLATTGTSTTLAITQTASETLTLPNISDTLVGRSTTDTLTNKTLTDNTDNIIARGLWDSSGAGSVSVYASTAPSTGQVLTATNSTTATWQSMTPYTTTATAAATTTLTASSTFLQYFTGTTTQTVQLPVTSTLQLGQEYSITNNSTGLVTITSSGGNVVSILQPNTTNLVTCILTSGTTAASWSGGTVFTYAANTPSGIAYDGTNVWVANTGGGNVLQVSATTGVILGTFTAGTTPQNVCYDPGTASVWITNNGSANVTQLSAINGATIGTYTVGTNPYGICTDGASIWVANNGSASVTRILASTGGIEGTYTVGTNPTFVCWDGSYIWVSNTGSGTVTQLDSNGTLLSTCTVGTNPYGLCFDGTYIWVANNGSNDLSRISALTNSPLPASTFQYAIVTAPFNICFDGTNLWVGTDSGGIIKVSPSTVTALGTYSVTASAGTKGVLFDGTNIWAVNNTNSTVSKLTQLGIPPSVISVPLLTGLGTVGRDINGNAHCNNVINARENYLVSNSSYAVGTASQSTTTITGSGTAWFPAMVGGTIVFANKVIAAITAYVSPTSLTSSASQTVTGQAYVIYYGTSYSTGTITADSNWTPIQIGTGTAFTPEMVGGWLIMTSGASLGVAGMLNEYWSPTYIFMDDNFFTTNDTFIVYYSTVKLTAASANQISINGVSNPFWGTFPALLSGNENAIFNGSGQYVMLPPISTLSVGQSYSITNYAPIPIVVGPAGPLTSLLDFVQQPPATVGKYTFVGSFPLTYSTGQASQSTTTVTGTGTGWTPALVGGTIVFANLSIGVITAYVSPTSLTVSTSQTVAGQAYIIYFGSSISVASVAQSGARVLNFSSTLVNGMTGGYIIYTSGASAGQVVQITYERTAGICFVSPPMTVSSGTNARIYYHPNNIFVTPVQQQNYLSWTYSQSPVSNGGYLTTLSRSITAATLAAPGTRAQLLSPYNIVTGVSATTDFVTLPATNQMNVTCTVINKGGFSLSVYPQQSGSIDGASTNASVTLPIGATATYITTGYDTSIQLTAILWKTVNPPPVAGNGISITYGNGGNTIASGSLFYTGVSASVTAAGSTQGTATALTTSYVIVTTAAASTGVIFPTPAAGGLEITIVNKGANPVNVYPAVGGQIDAAGTNVAVVIPVNGTAIYKASTTTQWYTIDPVPTAGTAISVTYGNGLTTFANTGATSIAGTSNQITASASTGAITLSTPSTFIAPGTIASTTSLTAGTLFYVGTSATVSAAGTTQGGATALTTSYNVITTAAASSGVVLPTPAVAGLEIIVVNNGANTVNVYPASGAQIDAAGTNVAVTLPVGGTAMYMANTTTQWETIDAPLIAGTAISVTYGNGQTTIANTGATSISGTANQITASAATGALTLSTPSTFIAPGTIASTTSLTAGTLFYEGTSATVSAAGTTQGGATALTNSYNVVTTAAASSGVVLPTPAAAGLDITVVNKGANTVNVYPASGGAIDGAGANTAVTIPVNASATYQAATTTQWYTIDPTLVAGTAVSVTYGNGQTTIANTGATSITGTVNQITASASTGAITLSVPEPATAITSASAGISNSETYISAAFPIGAGTIAAGDSFRILVYGTATVTATAPTATFNIRFGTAGTTGDTAILSPTYTTAVGSAIPFYLEMFVTFRSTTSAIASCTLSNNGVTGLSTTALVSNIGSAVTGLTTSAAFLGLSFVAATNKCTCTFQQIIVHRIR